MKNILEYLERSAKKYPDKIAFTDETSEITYRNFIAKAKTIGSYLSELGIRNAAIAVCLDKSADSLAAFMGVVYSGNFYTVIDTQMPADRIGVIFDTLSPAAVLTDRRHAGLAEELRSGGPVLLLEDLQETPPDEEALAAIRSKSIDTDPLYVLFTSGSTGVPKGTVICHRSVIAYAEWVTEAFQLDETTVFGNQTPFYFSMSVLDIFSTILNGATMHIIPKQLFSFPVKLFEYLNTRRVNTIYWVPSALYIAANWKAFDYVPAPPLQKILFAGEVMPPKVLNYWRSHLPDALFANLYGPTEITDICTYYIVNREFANDEPIPIGNACNNCDVLVLTPEGKEASPGEEGELYVRGSFLAMGYYNNPEKTAEVFVQNPLNPHYPEIVYKTGDLVKYNAYGELTYLTRKDFQIKHMGYRIELGEIETAVSALEDIAACACIYDTKDGRIVLFYQSRTLEDRMVMEAVRCKLPQYMLPNKLFRLPQMPHNSNGKIDRVRLKQHYETLKS